MFIATHISGFGGGASGTGLTISTNTSDVNILTLAAAAGYDNAVAGQEITMTINAGVTVSGSSSHAVRTGALHQHTTLIINNNGNINGYTGAAGSAGGLGAAGGVGSVGGDAIYIDTDTGGTGTLTVNNASGAYIQSGGGGGGGGGGAGRANECVYDGKSIWSCGGVTYTGSAGAAGSGGGFGAAGSTGASGSYGGGHYGGGSCPAGCVIIAVGAGAAGGAAGYAMRKNLRTVTLNDSGTTTGTVG